MRVERLSAGRCGGPSAEVRAFVPAGSDVAGDVTAIVAAVKAGGDAALDEYVRRFDAIGEAAVVVHAGS